MTLPLTFERIHFHDGQWWWEDVERHEQPVNDFGDPTPCPLCGSTCPCADLVPDQDAVPPW